MMIPRLTIKIMIESNPLKSRVLVQRVKKKIGRKSRGAEDLCTKGLVNREIDSYSLREKSSRGPLHGASRSVSAAQSCTDSSAMDLDEA